MWKTMYDDTGKSLWITQSRMPQIIGLADINICYYREAFGRLTRDPEHVSSSQLGRTREAVGDLVILSQ